MTHWFPFFGRDFLAATLGWSAEERGHYMTLLVAQWEQDGLPDDPKRLERISPGLRECWPVLAEKFPIGTDGKRRNVRLEHERHKSHERSERARQSASARWASGADAQKQGENDVLECGCVGICDRTCDRICSGDASMSMSYSPPPTPATPPDSGRDSGSEWHRLRGAWNAVWTGKRAWRSVEPPPEAVARLAEPGWLDEAVEAISTMKAKDGPLSGFASPPTLRQFCGRDHRGTFVARMLGGEFADRRRPSIQLKEVS